MIRLVEGRPRGRYRASPSWEGGTGRTSGGHAGSEESERGGEGEGERDG